MKNQLLKILILEDNIADYELMLRELDKVDYPFAVEWAASRNSFMEALERIVPDLLLADFYLPGFDGITAMNLVRRRSANIPVIIISGFIGEERAIETLKAGATDYVLKQRLDRLSHAVRRAIWEIEQEAQRKKAEAERRKLEEKYRFLVETADSAIILSDASGTIKYVNEFTIKFFGYEKELVLGHNFMTFASSPQAPEQALPVSLEEITSHPEKFFSIENEHRCKNGEPAWISWTIRAMLSENGKASEILLIGNDITSLKKSVESLKYRAMELTYANQELESFTSSVSHDLGAPVRMIEGFCKMLIEDYSDNLNDTAKEYLRRILSGTQKMNLIIKDLLKLSKISRQEVIKSQVDITALAWSIVDDLRNTDPGRDVHVHIENSLHGSADPGLLTVALTNLLGNAWKYTRKVSHAHIELGCLTKNSRRVFFIRDNGAGFDMKYYERLFIPFNRLHPDSEFPGTGIGLAIVNKIIKKHGGEIWAESEPGKGSIFYFALQ